MEQNENMIKDKNDAETVELNEREKEPVVQENSQSEPVQALPKKEEIDFKAKYYYIAAEMENYRKRMEREKENLLKFGNERVLSDLVQVVDNLERTTDMLKSDEDQRIKNIVIGIDMVKKQFLETLSKHGLSTVESIGKEFDPNFHEALAQEYVEGKKPNEIIKEFQKGYTLNGRLVRASKVVVSNNKQ